MKGTQATDGVQWQNPATMALEDVIREGARRMLQTAIEVEVVSHIQRLAEVTDAAGHRMVVRNGWKPERSIQTATRFDVRERRSR
jgi:hypothetical protein